MKIKRLQGGALQLIMFISVIIALLLVGFIMLIHTHKYFNLQSNLALESIKNSGRGIEYVLQNGIRKGDTISVELYDESFKTLKVCSDYWGIFQKVTSVSSIKASTVKKVALVGIEQSNDNRTALYLKEKNKPLIVVGNTKIQGTVYLPKRGVKSGNISGQSYYGTELIYGSKELSTKFPKLDKETVEFIKISQQFSNNLQANQYIDLKQSKTHKNSFLNPLKVVYSNSDINLTEVSLTGHIIVQSSSKIIVSASSTLKDVVLIAPIIEVKDHTKGSFQALASKRILIGKYCQLNYPSSLILNKSDINQSDEIEHSITIDSGTTIKGMVVYLGTLEPNNFNPQITIEKNATIKGEVYCQQSLQLKGAVYGSVFTNNFLTKASGSIYQNHLYDAEILVDKLSKKYVGIPINDSNKDVVKWLY